MTVPKLYDPELGIERDATDEDVPMVLFAYHALGQVLQAVRGEPALRKSTRRVLEQVELDRVALIEAKYR